MSDESETPQRPHNPIAILASRKEVEDTEAAIATALREEWPDWIFDRAIDTDLSGPQGEPYIRLDRISWHVLGLADDDTGDPAKRRGPPAHARVPTQIRDLVDGRVHDMPEEWAEKSEYENTHKNDTRS